ncbi:MAG: hypothetical protein WBW74_11485 [Xanthobacteraceae bacterium]
MNKYPQVAATAILLLGATTLVPAETANPVGQSTTSTVDLSPEQEDAIYGAVTDGLRERNLPEIRVGDESPWWAEVRTLPESLQIKSVKGLLYAILLVRGAEGIHNEVLLVDPSTNKVVGIIRKPLTFKF